MKYILKAFRGDPDNLEVTLPMKCLLGSFGIMLALVPISLYVMLQDNVSDQMFATFLYILVVDLAMMLFADVLMILIWCPPCYSKDQKRDKINSRCATQCLPGQITSDSVFSSVPTDMFKDISIGELSRRLCDLHDDGEQAAKESSPEDKPVCAVEVHKSSTSKSNKPNLDQNRDFPKPTPVSEQRFVSMRGHQQQVLFKPRPRDIEAIENLAYGYAGEPSREYDPNQGQSDTFSRNFSVPGPSQKGLWYHKKREYLKADPQRSMGDSEGKENNTLGYTGDAAQSKACEPNYVNKDKSGYVSMDVGFAGHVKGKKNPNSFPPQQCMTDLKQNNTSKYASGADQSKARDGTDDSQDRTSSGHVSQEDGLRHDGHRKRFWTEPRPRDYIQETTRDSTKGEDETNHQSSEDDVVIKNNKDEERKKKYEVKPAVRGFIKLKKRYNPPDYMMESGFRKRFATSSVLPSNINDALELVPLSHDQSKLSTTAAWVFDDKNELPSKWDSSPSLKRSRSAPPNRGHQAISSTTKSSDPSNRFPIPACSGDSRHRVLHRLLATILTTGDDVMATYPELENINEVQDAPKMEVEALPSGDYVMHISMSLTSKELENFRSRRATNINESEFKKYLATLC